MNINYDSPFNFKPIPTITVADDYWQNGTWKFNMSEITAGAASQPSWIDIILHGNTALTLTNALANGLNYLKLFGGTELLPETYLDSVTLSGGTEQNGTPTPDSPVDIVCNNGTIKVSPNLFNKNLVPDVNEYINKTNGNAAAPSAGEFRHSDFIVIKKNTQYYVGIITSFATSAGLAFYDDTKTYISGISLTQLGNDDNIIRSPNNAKYIRFSFRTDEGYNTNWQNTVYLVEGNQPLAEFMPYGIYTDGTQEVVTDSNGLTATAQMLLSVNDYKDTQEVLSGSVTRNVGIKVLDGTEEWYAETSLSGYGCSISDAILPTTSDSRLVITTHYKSSTTFPPAGQREGVCVLYYGPSRRNLYVGAMKTYTTVEQFKQFLADQYANGTPVIVVYPLATATTETVTGQFLSKSPVTQTAGSIDNLPIAITESQKTTPTPQQPLQINCNNGVLKLSPNLFDKNVVLGGTIRSEGIDGDPNPARARLEYLYLPTGTYTISNNGNTVNQCLGASYSNDTGSGFSRIDSWAWHDLPFTFTLTSNRYVRFMVRNSSDIELTTDNIGKFQLEQGSTALPFIPYGQIYTDGITETVEVTGNLVDFNETRINSSTWDSADKTKGFEVCADVYQKAVGDSMLSNANAFGVFVPCKQGESISLNFFDYEPFYSRCLYCEITADRKCNTTPQAYDNANAIIQKTFTLTQSDSIGFVIEWYISGERVRNYTKENYTVIKGQTPPTSYIPYFNGGSATAEMLLKVGDYKDVQSVLDGGVTRNVGIKVLDGTENWTWVSGEGHPWRGTASIPNSTQVNSASAISTHFASSKILLTSGNLYIRYLNDNGITTKDEWLQFLQDQYNAGFPVIVVYPLATATTESVTGQPLSIQAGTNIVSITQASIENLGLEISYKAGVAVTITEVENAQLDNNVEVTIQ